MVDRAMRKNNNVSQQWNIKLWNIKKMYIAFTGKYVKTIIITKLISNRSRISEQGEQESYVFHDNLMNICLQRSSSFRVYIRDVLCCEPRNPSDGKLSDIHRLLHESIQLLTCEELYHPQFAQYCKSRDLNTCSQKGHKKVL